MERTQQTQASRSSQTSNVLPFSAHIPINWSAPSLFCEEVPVSSPNTSTVPPAACLGSPFQQREAVSSTPVSSQQSLVQSTSGSNPHTRSGTSGEGTSAPGGQKSSSRATRHSADEKLEAVLEFIYDKLNWNLSAFLYQLFRLPDSGERTIRRSRRHAGTVSAFLRGTTKYTPANILHLWYKSPDGKLEDETEMFNLDTPYYELKSARAAMSSFAAQLTLQKMLQERSHAIKPSSNLHVATRTSGVL
jgi:hypothetical protein